jgi:hypothetical protein
MIIWSFVTFFIGFATVLSEVIIERHKNKGDDNKQYGEEIGNEIGVRKRRLEK